MYYPDLSAYAYLPPPNRFCDNDTALNFGWLDTEHSFRTGTLSQNAQARLLELSRRPEHKTRGFHQCPFCGVRVGVDDAPGVQHFLGSAEVHVPADGVTYVAPNLVVHYVMQYRYLPPPQVVQALERMSP